MIGWGGNCQSSLIHQWLFHCNTLWWWHTHTHQKLLDHDKFLSTALLNWFVKRRSSLILVPPQIPIRKMHSPRPPPGPSTTMTDAWLFECCILILPDASLQSSTPSLRVLCQYILVYLCQLFMQRGIELEIRAPISSVKVLIFGNKWVRENGPCSFVIALTKKGKKMPHCRKDVHVLLPGCLFLFFLFGCLNQPSKHTVEDDPAEQITLKYFNAISFSARKK